MLPKIFCVNFVQLFFCTIKRVDWFGKKLTVNLWMSDRYISLLAEIMSNESLVDMDIT